MLSRRSPGRRRSAPTGRFASSADVGTLAGARRVESSFDVVSVVSVVSAAERSVAFAIGVAPASRISWSAAGGTPSPAAAAGAASPRSPVDVDSTPAREALAVDSASICAAGCDSTMGSEAVGESLIAVGPAGSPPATMTPLAAGDDAAGAAGTAAGSGGDATRSALAAAEGVPEPPATAPEDRAVAVAAPSLTVAGVLSTLGELVVACGAVVASATGCFTSDAVAAGDAGVEAATDGDATGAGVACGGAGGGGTTIRGGRNESGSTYPFGSDATRMPRWTYGPSTSASPVGPTVPTGEPSATVAPLPTEIEPRWTNVTAYASPVRIVTVRPLDGTEPANVTVPPAAASTGAPGCAARSMPRCSPPS